MFSANSNSNSPHEVFPFSRTFIPTAIETSTLTATVTAHPSPSSSSVSDYTELNASAVAGGTAGGIAALMFILSIAAVWWRRTHRAPSPLSTIQPELGSQTSMIPLGVSLPVLNFPAKLYVGLSRCLCLHLHPRGLTLVWGDVGS